MSTYSRNVYNYESYMYYRRRAIAAMYLLSKNKQKRKNKVRFHVRPIFQNRLEQGAFHNLIAEMRLNDKEKFYNYLRMSADQFDELVRIVGPNIYKTNKFRDDTIDTISPEERLSLKIRYLASGDSMISTSYNFRIGKTSISNIIKETCKEIWECLKDNYLLKVNEENWDKIADDYNEKWNFPNCIGAIDGKHVVIEAPPNSGSSFFNYKGQHSIILMAMCDANYCFTLVDVGASGRQSDGGVFKASNMGKNFHGNAMHIPPPKTVQDGPILPYVVVADEAFQLTNFMLRPYPGRGTLEREKQIFNYRLSRARRVIENTFGILANKWRIYRKPISASVETIENIVLATVCLHNFLKKYETNVPACQKRYCPPEFVDREDEDGNVILGAWRNDQFELPKISNVASNAHSRNASAIREQFKNYFNNEGAIPWQWKKVDDRKYF